MKVLTEASGSLVSASIIKTLKNIGIDVVASDITEFNAGAKLADDYIILPRVSDELMWEKIIKILINENIKWIIPSLDEMLLGWSERAEDLRLQGFDIIISPHETIQLFTDKWFTYNAFLDADLPTPKTSLEKKYSMVKPRSGRGSKGIEVTDKKVSMKGKISQEIVNGTEVTVDCLFDKNGLPIYIIPRIRLKVIDGKSVSAVTIRNKKIDSNIKKLSSKFHFIGPVNIQCFMDDGKLYFIEVNPRVGGGMVLGWEASENWFDLWFNKIIHGKSIQPKPVKYGLRMDRYYSEIFSEVQNSII